MMKRVLRRLRERRAFALPLVLALSLLLVGALSTTLLSVHSAVQVNESMLHRRQAFHAAEGISLAALEMASSQLRALPLKPPLAESDPGYAAAMTTLLASNRAALNGFLNDPSNVALLTPTGYTLLPEASSTKFSVDDLGEPKLKELEGGPFDGMFALVQPLTLSIAVRRDNDRTPATQRVQAQVERATMSMFQFYVFSDVYLDLDPGGPVDARGRIHTNQDFCVAGQPRIDTVTAAGDILMSNRDGHRCRRRAGEGNNIRIATNDSFSAFATLTKDHDAADWVSYARTTFGGRALDSAHGVGPLRMPLSGRPRVQAGASVLAMEQVPDPGDDSLLVPIAQAREDNTTSMRFLVDPMLDTEPEDVREQKFAFKADVRIIDGVWFIRDPANPRAIGTPVWSDHPGNGSTSYAGNPAGIVTSQVVGQEDLRSSAGWGGNTPLQYSYYSFEPDTAPGTLRWARSGASPRAVISYGLLDNAGGDLWTPGTYTTAPTTTAPGAIGPASSLTHFLAGARSGFKDGWLETRSESLDPPPSGSSPGNSAVETKRSRMLPINFDVLAFLDALQTCAPGQNELGSHFRGTCTGNKAAREFNGIVYVAATWPGSMDGLGDTPASSTFAKLSPFHAENNTDGNVVADPGLPMPLCFPSPSAPPVITGAPAPLSPTSPPALATTLTRCDQMGRATPNRSFPNMLRLFNARHISPPTSTTYPGTSVVVRADVLPKGLTIATNLPVVVMGNANVDTTPQRLRTDPLPANDHFVPFLVAGDRFYRFSTRWQDELANWVQPMNANARPATPTTQYLEVLAGWNPTPSTPLAGHDHSSDGFEDFPRYLECWGGSNPVTYAGSIVVGFASVYTRSGANNGDGNINVPTGFTFATCFPARDEGYDFHLENPANQPPGAPQILAQSVGSFTAR
jgi:hypothetical protein